MQKDKRNSVLNYAAPGVLSLAPYQPGKPLGEAAREYGVADAIKLASNENPLGCSPRAAAAIAKADASAIARYPDSNAAQLRGQVAARLGVSSPQIIFGNGSNDVLELAAHLTLRPGAKGVMSAHAFIVYFLATVSRGGGAVIIPAKNFAHDLIKMAKACEDNSARVVFLANPNNPTGTWHPPESVYEFLRAIPPHVLIVLDEAYHEYVCEGPGESINWLGEFSNLLITRTFSKVHGLAGLRIGYGIGAAELIDVLNRIRQPFNVGGLAQMAASAALEDDDFINRSRKINADGMHQLENGFNELGINFIPSRGNFICFEVGDAAKQINESLLRGGVIVRELGGYKMPSHLRVTVGTESENIRFLNQLRLAMKGGGGK